MYALKYFWKDIFQFPLEIESKKENMGDFHSFHIYCVKF